MTDSYILLCLINLILAWLGWGFERLPVTKSKACAQCLNQKMKKKSLMGRTTEEYLKDDFVKQTFIIHEICKSVYYTYKNVRLFNFGIRYKLVRRPKKSNSPAFSTKIR